MARRQPRDVLTDSVEDALRGPWAHLEHSAQATDPLALGQAFDNIEDAGHSEERVLEDYTGRYPIELLQNAHDACAYADHIGTVRFVVTESALLVANEGEPFTPRRIRSLVRLGSSEKAADRDRRQTIGYKGVGFTAVFEVTDRPQVISKDIAFG